MRHRRQPDRKAFPCAACVKRARTHKRCATSRPHPAGTNRKVLLLGTALASTLLIGTLLAPDPAHAQVTECADPGPSRVEINDAAPVECINTEFRDGSVPTDGDAIYIVTTGDGSDIYVNNSGVLVGPYEGLHTRTIADDSPVELINSGAISVGNDGILANTQGENSAVTIANSGTITNLDDEGIEARTFGDNSAITIINSGIITADEEGIQTYTDGVGNFIRIVNDAAVTSVTEEGIQGTTFGDNSAITIINSGDVTADEDGLEGDTSGANSGIDITNSGVIIAGTQGIEGTTDGYNSAIGILNSGDIITSAEGDFVAGSGIFAQTEGNDSPIGVENHGGINVTLVGNYSNAVGIYAQTEGNDSPIGIENSGGLTVTATGNTINAYGIFAETVGDGNPIGIDNHGDITATAAGYNSDAFGIFALTTYLGSPIGVLNEALITVTTTGAYAEATGITSITISDSSPIGILNSGDITVTTSGYAAYATGIFAATDSVANSLIAIENSGNINATTAGVYGDTVGIDARTEGYSSPISIENHGDITSTAAGFGKAFGIRVGTGGADSPVVIENHGDISATATGTYGDAYGIHGFAISASAFGQGSPIRIENSGDLVVRAADDYTYIAGINAQTPYNANNRPIDIVNRGNIDSDGAGILAVAGDGSFNPIGIANHGAIRSVGDGISSHTDAASSGITIVNTGHVVTGEGTYYSRGFGVFALTLGPNSPIAIGNAGAIDSGNAGLFANSLGAGSPIEITNSGPIKSVGDGIFAVAEGTASAISIINAGDVDASAEEFLTGDAIFARTRGRNSPIVIVNAGHINGEDDGIDARAVGDSSSISIVNRGDITASGGGDSVGIYALSNTGTAITNYGYVSSDSLFAVDTHGAATGIYNMGRITGFVDLTDESDTFFNQAGGVFETKLTSDFHGGNDLFRNEGGGTVLGATNPNVSERSAFVNLERFENSGGTISLVDGREGDIFRISNVPGPPDSYFYKGDIVFSGSGGSTLAVDASLDGPGSQSDILIIDGDVRGKTALSVNNTNPGAGTFNPTGIPVVYVGGNVKSNAFFLPQPIDTGFFQYDLFFQPEGSGVFELRSFTGPGALLLPQLVTGAQDIWHQGSSTWFDRTADLRVLLAGGVSPTAYDPNAKYAEGAAIGPTAFTPAVWARGAGAWLDRDASETVSAYGRDYRFNLDRDLEVMDWQMGLDLGHRDLMAPGEILVFGVLGGFVNADLDYDRLVRQFDFDGVQVGGYATYLRGGLFVDTLLNAHLLELETRTTGFANSLDANTLGLRTDTGYRFGSFNGGAFLEPLATIAVLWSDIDGFTNGGNKVAFDDEANVRGRLGLRAGTSYPVWTGTTMEPFVIGSLWGNLSGDNQATLASNGTNFRFEDDLDDVWGEVSAGVNFFNPSAGTAVFAKVDVTFGDDVDGIGGKAGMRVAW